MTPALTIAQDVRAAAYDAGLVINHVDDLLLIAGRLSQIAHDRSMWLRVMPADLHEIEAALYEAVSAALLEGVEAFGA